MKYSIVLSTYRSINKVINSKPACTRGDKPRGWPSVDRFDPQLIKLSMAADDNS